MQNMMMVVPVCVYVRERDGERDREEEIFEKERMEFVLLLAQMLIHRRGVNNTNKTLKVN